MTGNTWQNPTMLCTGLTNRHPKIVRCQNHQVGHVRGRMFQVWVQSNTWGRRYSCWKRGISMIWFKWVELDLKVWIVPENSQVLHVSFPRGHRYDQVVYVCHQILTGISQPATRGVGENQILHLPILLLLELAKDALSWQDLIPESPDQALWFKPPSLRIQTISLTMQTTKLYNSDHKPLGLEP